MRRFLLLIGFLAFSGIAVQAQILDDSTKVVYSAKTTRFITEDNIKWEHPVYTHPDTMLNKVHRWEPVERSWYKYQDLGTVGTAMNPILMESPDHIGRGSGFYAFKPYYKSPKDFRYFDTKSPFTSMRSVFGAHGRALLDATFTRNITPTWNAGIDFKRFTIDKQIGPLQNKGDINVLSTSYDFFTDYATKDGKYRLLANFVRLNHQVNETGGILAADSVPQRELFGYTDEEIRMHNAEGGSIIQNYHVYHQYKINELVGLYHESDRSNQVNYFHDYAVDQDDAYLKNMYIRTDSTQDITKYLFWKNEVGVKGHLNDWFYGLYYKRKDIHFSEKYLPGTDVYHENYGGVRVGWNKSDSLHLIAYAEYMDANAYKLGGNIALPYFKASLSITSKLPPLLYRRYFGNHNIWETSLNNEEMQQANISFPLSFGKISLTPNATFTRVTNYIYFDQDIKPAQNKDQIWVATPALDLNINLKPFYWYSTAKYTLKGGTNNDVYRVPELMAYGDVYFQKYWFNSALLARFGLQWRYFSTYKAPDYDPVTQQFYLQDSFTVPGYLLADLYLDFKIGDGRLFFKLRHVDQDIQAGGYFTAPFYTGQQRGFDIGITWYFFN